MNNACKTDIIRFDKRSESFGSLIVEKEEVNIKKPLRYLGSILVEKLSLIKKNIGGLSKVAFVKWRICILRQKLTIVERVIFLKF